MIQTDALKSGWVGFCNGVLTEGKLSENEKNLQINILELIAAKFAILTFTKGQSNIPIHWQIDSETALSNLLKIQGTNSTEPLSIWNYLL